MPEIFLKSVITKLLFYFILYYFYVFYFYNVGEIDCYIQQTYKIYYSYSGETLLVKEADCPPPHKIDENMWKNREQIEEILFLLERSHWPPLVRQKFLLFCYQNNSL